MAEGAGGKEVGRISVRVVPNLDGFYRKLREAVDAAEKGTVVELEVDLKTGDIRGELKAATEGISAQIDVDANTAGVREKIKAAVVDLDATVKVKPDVQKTDFQRALAEVKAAAKAADVKVKIDVNDKEAEARFAATLAKLKAEARLAKIKVTLDVDRRGLSRGGAAASLVGDSLSNVTGAAGGAMRALSNDTTLIAVALVSFLAPALALVSGLLVSLPAIIAAVALPIGVVALGIKGLGEAAKVLEKPFKALQETMSKKFQDVFTPIFQGLAPVLPVMGQALLPIVDRLGDMAKGLFSVVTSADGLKALQDTVGGIGEAMRVAVPGIKDLALGMLQLIAGGAKNLPKFSALLNDMGSSFSNWVTKITTVDWWGTSPLDRALSNFTTALQGIMDLLGELGSDGFDMLTDPKMGTDIKTFFNDLKDIIHQALPQLKDFFHELAGFLHEANSLLSDNKGKKAPDWLSGDFLNNPKLGKDPLDRIKTLGKNFDPAALNPFALMGQWATDAFDSIDWSGIGTSISGAWDTIVAVIQTKIGQIQAIISFIPDAVGGIWDGIVAEAQGAWDGVVAGAQNFVGQIGTTVGQIPATIGNIWEGIAGAAAGAWDGIVAEVQNAMSQFVSAVQTGIGNAVSVFSSLPGQVLGILEGLAGQVFAAGAHIIQNLVNGLLSIDVSGAVSSVFGKIQSLIPHSPAKTGPFSGSGWTDLFSGGQAIGNQFNDGLKDGFQGVVGSAQLLVKQVQDAISQGVVPPGLKDNLQQELKALGVEYDQLRVQKDATTDKGTKKNLGDQMKQVQTLKDQLRLQQDQLGYSDKYGDNQDDISKQFGSQLTKIVDIGKGFADANIKQFVTDLGGSGSGALPTVAEAGVGWLTGMLGHVIQGALSPQIHVNSVDEAMSARTQIVNKQAMQFVGR